MLQQKLERALADVDAETVAGWYAQLNCFGTPAFLPVRLRAVHNKKRAMRDRKRRALMHAIEAVLGPRGTSRAWWLYGLRRSEDEWLQWWTVDRAKTWAMFGLAHDGHHLAANARNQLREPGTGERQLD